MYSRVFAKTFTGLVFVVLVYSLLKSRCISINIGIIPVLIFILFLSGNKFSFAPIKQIKGIAEDKKAVFPVILLLSILFACQYWLIMVTNNGFPAIINFDDLFNAHAAMYLNYSGIETLDWNYLAGTADSISPYHYSLFWIISFLSALFGQNAYLITELSVNPLLYFLLILGFWAFAEKYSITPFIKIFSCLILFVCGLHVSFMDKHSLFNWSYFYFNIFVPDAKLTLYYVVIVASLLLWQNAKYNIALLVFLLLPIFSIVYAPSVFAVCFILIFTHSVLKKKPEVKLFLYLLTVAAIVFMFYRIFNKEQMLGIPAFSLNLAAPFLFSLKTFVYKSEVALIVYFPYLLAIAYSLLFSRSLNFKNVTAAVYFIVISFIFVLDGFI